MTTKRYRRSNKSKELTYEDIKGLDFNSLTPEELEKYGFGSWLKNSTNKIGEVTGLKKVADFAGDAVGENIRTGVKEGLSTVSSAVGDFHTALADTYLGVVGAGDVIKKDAYETKIGTTAGEISSKYIAPVAGQIAANIVAPGWGGAALGAVQAGAGSLQANYDQKKLVQSQNAQAAKIEKQQNLNIANQELQQKMNDNPLYSGVMRRGGKLKKLEGGGNTPKDSTKYYLNTYKGEREITPEEVSDYERYLELNNRLRDVYQKTYKTRISNLNKKGINSPDSYAEHIKNMPDDILPSMKYTDLYKKAKFTDEEISFFDPARNKNFGGDYLAGTNESKDKNVTDLDYAGRQHFANLALGIKKIPVKVPTEYKPATPYSYEPLRGYPNMQIGYTMDETGGKRTPSVFRNAAGQEVPIDPKKGLTVESYPELANDMQYTQPKKPLSQMRFKYGGTLNYGGQLHEGPDGGVPVDEMGNPNQINPVALVEKGEVSYNTPDGGTYIYSDTLKHDKNKTFAKKAKDVQRRYKFRMKDGVINDPFAKKSYDNEMLGLMDNQEELRDFQNMQSLQKKKYGGDLPLYWGGSTLPPLIKPIDNTAAMDEFVNQVEMDYPSRIQPNLNFKLKTSTVLPKGSQVKSDIINTQGVPATKPELYQGMNWAETGLAAAAPVLGGITGMILEGTNKTRPKKLSLSRMTPQQISLERRRRAAREGAGVATSNLSRALKGASPTSGSYMSNVVAGITDIDRNLSNQLGESYTQEEIQNAQFRQQADQVNADLAMQETMYNTEVANQFDASRKARMNAYLSQIGQGVTSALNQKFQSSRDADFLNMLNPNYELGVTGRGLNRKRYYRPRT